TWTIHVANGGTAAASFNSGQTIFFDNLPNANIAYGAVTVTDSAGVSGTGSIACSINASSNLVCTVSGGTVTMGTSTASTNPFTLVANGPGTAQLFGLTSDAQGRVYIGNNANNTTGIPLQEFDPT